jgi:hypothetical protein
LIYSRTKNEESTQINRTKQITKPDRSNRLEREKTMDRVSREIVTICLALTRKLDQFKSTRFFQALKDQRGDVPGWVLVVLMTTGLVTAIWTIAAPRLTAILRNSLDAMNGIR